jgi:acyl-CoA reductase-like NAD-dependent aldehyde dehydrogenase
MSKAREQPLRLDVRKTYKLFIDGEFVRSESGRIDVVGSGTDDSANVARASRKDLRDAVVAARSGFDAWSRISAAQRGMALYQLAETMDARRAELIDRLESAMKFDEPAALRETNAAIDRALWYAGWCDKYASLVSSRDPVSGPYTVHSKPEPVGVVGVIAPDDPSLLGLISAAIPPLVAGNSVVVVASEVDPRTSIVFAECIATCDFPDGAVNVLTGRRIELAPHLARHMDINALEAFALDGPFAAELERLSADNLKRTRMFGPMSTAEWFSSESADLANVTAFTELKTIWHSAAI